MHTQFRVEVIADFTKKWTGNQMRYATFDEAKDAALKLAHSWLAVEAARVVEFDASGPIDETEVF